VNGPTLCRCRSVSVLSRNRPSTQRYSTQLRGVGTAARILDHGQRVPRAGPHRLGDHQAVAPQSREPRHLRPGHRHARAGRPLDPQHIPAALGGVHPDVLSPRGNAVTFSCRQVVRGQCRSCRSAHPAGLPGPVRRTGPSAPLALSTATRVRGGRARRPGSAVPAS
jgi:hypothetical protein